ncbi:YihY/virulence factor BrkB family protein [Planctomicrobium sp. SH668]|uniref:YihY/virulence factor BrkB family protein n=1 Tax=Planctomicrobium sp. SH668 TaxID=3448126 RepID=UPI003F5C925E
MKIIPKRTARVLYKAGLDFVEDDCMTMAAAIAYYAIFSITPLTVLLMLIAGRIWGEEVAQRQLLSELTQIIGEAASGFVVTTVEEARPSLKNYWAMVVSSVVFVLGTTGVMLQMKAALNRVWNGDELPAKSAVLQALLNYLFSFLMVLAIAGLLLGSLVMTAILNASLFYLDPYVTSSLQAFLSSWGRFLVTFLVVVISLAMLFRWLPEAKVHWRDVWFGAILTALLFNIGKELLGKYLGTMNLAGYGGAGALVLLLVWVYYTSLILLFGAEVTQARAQLLGEHHRWPLLTRRRKADLQGKDLDQPIG